MTTQEAECLLNEVFSRIFSKEKVVMTRAQPLQDDLYRNAAKLHTYKKKFRYYWTHNNEWLKLARRDGTKIRREMMIKNKGGCLWCRDASMVDAEDHYKNKII
jgi:hypothetical protein